MESMTNSSQYDSVFTNTSQETDYESDYPVYDYDQVPARLHFDYFVTAMYIFLIIFGSAGNILSIYILTRRDIGVISTKIYLVTLAVADLLCLDIIVLVEVLWSFKVDVTTWHDVTCKLRWYVVIIVFAISYWIQVAISVDRCVAIALPYRYRDIKQKHRVFVVVGIVAFFMIFESPRLVNMKLFDSNGYIYCMTESDDFRYYLGYPWRWIDLVLSFIIPFVTMVTCSGVMVANLMSTRRAMRGSTRRDAVNTTRKASKLFLALNIVFIVTNLPKRILWLVFWIRHVFNWYIYNSAVVLMYSNHAVNFILYILHIPKFRAVFKRMLRCRCCGVGEGNLRGLETDDTRETREGLSRAAHGETQEGLMEMTDVRGERCVDREDGITRIQTTAV